MHFMSAPFTSRQLSPCGEDWVSQGPGFIGVGAPKSGTSWWYSLLLQHPRVAQNRLACKELAYFYHFGFNGPSQEQAETYRRAFDCPRGKISGEWSPSYLFFPCALEFLADTVPGARILILLRNPIDRLLSHVNQFQQTHVRRFEAEDIQRIVEKYWGLPDAAAQSLYSPGVSRALSRFGRSNVLILQYERCRQNVESELARTCRFLELEAFEPVVPTAPVNESIYSAPPLTSAERANLSRCFRDDVHRLCEQTDDIDPALWPDFAR